MEDEEAVEALVQQRRQRVMVERQHSGNSMVVMSASNAAAQDPQDELLLPSHVGFPPDRSRSFKQLPVFPSSAERSPTLSPLRGESPRNARKSPRPQQQPAKLQELRDQLLKQRQEARREKMEAGVSEGAAGQGAPPMLSSQKSALKIGTPLPKKRAPGKLVETGRMASIQVVEPSEVPLQPAKQMFPQVEELHTPEDAALKEKEETDEALRCRLQHLDREERKRLALEQGVPWVEEGQEEGSGTTAEWCEETVTGDHMSTESWVDSLKSWNEKDLENMTPAQLMEVMRKHLLDSDEPEMQQMREKIFRGEEIRSQKARLGSSYGKRPRVEVLVRESDIIDQALQAMEDKSVGANRLESADGAHWGGLAEELLSMEHLYRQIRDRDQELEKIMRLAEKRRILSLEQDLPDWVDKLDASSMDPADLALTDLLAVCCLYSPLTCQPGGS